MISQLKKFLCALSLLSLLVGVFSPFSPEVADAASGGPDTYGYRYWDSASGVSYSWISHTGSATTITGRSDDSVHGPYSFGFTFNFYGTDQTQFYVCNNGYISFTSSCGYNNVSIPTSGSPDDYIAPWWDDLYAAGTIKYEMFGSSPDRYMAVSWEGVNHINYQAGAVSFQAILYESNNKIKFQYSDVTFDSASYDAGISATVGIEKTGGSDGLQYSSGTASLSANLAIEFGLNPSIEQAAYKFFYNKDSTDVNTALAADNTAYALTLKGQEFRLRMLLAVTFTGMAQSAGSFKLQYVGKGSGSCASPSSGTPSSWTDISTTTYIAYKDNTTPTDGSALTANAYDPTHNSNTIVNQTYEEANNFTNSQATIPSGQDGKWDFSLYDYNSAANTTYCIRAVDSFSGSALNTYTYYPEITTRASSGGPDTYGYEWADSNGSATAYSWDDISGTGTSIGSRTDDQMKGPYDIGFDFSFYGNTQTQFYVCNNGFISFSNDTCAYTDVSIPTSATPNNLIAPWWDDLTTSGTIYYQTKGTAPMQYLVISFNGISRLNATGDVTFQVILYQSSNKIRFQYSDVDFVETMYSGGRLNTTGIENSDGTIGTQIGSNSLHLSNSLAIDFTLRYRQTAYRFFANQDNVSVTTALAAQDTAATLSADGDAFRLRMLVQNAGDNLAVSGQNFKLQYVGKGNGSCASPSGGTPASWTDVDTTTSVAYYDNVTPSDNTALTSTGSDPTYGSVVSETYEELNNFTNSQSALTPGDSGMWDFSLYDKTAAAGSVFCLRAAKSDGTALNIYYVYPEITTASSQSLTFSISDNSIGFGALSFLKARYATGDVAGSDTNPGTGAHNIMAASSSGYSITVQGATLRKDGSGASISAISSAATAYTQGAEQFGIYIQNGATGSGAVCSSTSFGCGGDYSGASSTYFYNADISTSKKVAGCSSSCTTADTYYPHYLASISVNTVPGSYSTSLTYVAAGSF